MWAWGAVHRDHCQCCHFCVYPRVFSFSLTAAAVEQRWSSTQCEAQAGRQAGILGVEAKKAEQMCTTWASRTKKLNTYFCDRGCFVWLSPFILHHIQNMQLCPGAAQRPFLLLSSTKGPCHPWCSTSIINYFKRGLARNFFSSLPWMPTNGGKECLSQTPPPKKVKKSKNMIGQPCPSPGPPKNRFCGKKKKSEEVKDYFFSSHCSPHWPRSNGIYVSMKGMWGRIPGLKSSSLSDGH